MVAVCTAFALLASPAVGSVLPSPAPAQGQVVRFEARGTHGYKVSVYAPLGRGSRVSIDVENNKGGAQYVAAGNVTATRISASFGRFGRISMHFEPSGKVLRSHLYGDSSCPHPASARVGTFSGSFLFVGEQGYTTVDLHRVDGGVGAATAPFSNKEELGLGCHHEETLAETALPTTLPVPFGGGAELVPGGLYLDAIAPTEFGHTYIFAGPLTISGAQPSIPTTLVIGLVQEEIEAVRIGRLVLAGGPSAEVLSDPGTLSTATLTPGAPFTGSATYTAGAGGIGTLDGDLDVPMLGAGVVPFAGPNFQAELLRPETSAAN